MFNILIIIALSAVLAGQVCIVQCMRNIVDGNVA